MSRTEILQLTEVNTCIKVLFKNCILCFIISVEIIIGMPRKKARCLKYFIPLSLFSYDNHDNHNHDNQKLSKKVTL